MDYYKGTIPILDQFGERRTDMTHPKGVRFGLVPRDYSLEPETMLAGPETLDLIDPSEYDARYDEEEEQESSLEHLFLRGGKPAWVNLDQNGDGHCWAYSTAQSMMFAYLMRGATVPRLNPHFLATYLRTFNGGWCGKSMKAAGEVGCPVEGNGPDEWPLHSNNTSLVQSRLAGASKHKVVENVYDLTREIWDQELTLQQIATCNFNLVATPNDFNWWGHSVCGIRHVRVERGSWGRLILNSWKGWGRFGLAVLRGSQAIPDGAVATRTVT